MHISNVDEYGYKCIDIHINVEISSDMTFFCKENCDKNNLHFLVRFNVC